MTKFCESCHTENRDRAKYCRGCAGRFSGIRTAANVSAAPLPEGRPTRAARVPRGAQPSAVSMSMPIPKRSPAATTANDLFVVPRTTEKREFARQLVLPGGLDVPVVLLLMIVLLSIASFVFWYWDRTAERTLAPSHGAAPIHWQQSDLQAPSLTEPPTNASPAAAPITVAPRVERPVDVARSRREPQAETQAFAPAPAPALPRVAAPKAQAPQALRPVDALQTARPPRQALAAPQRDRPSLTQRDRSMTGATTAMRTVPSDQTAATEPVFTDTQRTPQAQQTRIASPAPATRPTATVQIGTARAAGSMTRCDPNNPFGEAICV